jgi:hypothetical protein
MLSESRLCKSFPFRRDFLLSKRIPDSCIELIYDFGLVTRAECHARFKALVQSTATHLLKYTTTSSSCRPHAVTGFPVSVPLFVTWSNMLHPVLDCDSTHPCAVLEAIPSIVNTMLKSHKRDLRVLVRTARRSGKTFGIEKALCALRGPCYVIVFVSGRRECRRLRSDFPWKKLDDGVRVQFRVGLEQLVEQLPRMMNDKHGEVPSLVIYDDNAQWVFCKKLATLMSQNLPSTKQLFIETLVTMDEFEGGQTPEEMYQDCMDIIFHVSGSGGRVSDTKNEEESEDENDDGYVVCTALDIESHVRQAERSLSMHPHVTGVLKIIDLPDFDRDTIPPNWDSVRIPAFKLSD